MKRQPQASLLLITILAFLAGLVVGGLSWRFSARLLTKPTAVQTSASPSPTSTDAWDSLTQAKLTGETLVFRSNEIKGLFKYPTELGLAGMYLSDGRDENGLATGKRAVVRFTGSESLMGTAITKDFTAPLDGSVQLSSEVKESNGTCTYGPYGPGYPGPCEKVVNKNGATYYIGKYTDERVPDHQYAGLVLAISTNNKEFPWLIFSSARMDDVAQAVLKQIGDSFQSI